LILLIILILLCCYWCRRKKEKENGNVVTKTEVVKETNVIYKNNSFDDKPTPSEDSESSQHFYDEPKQPEPFAKRFITILNTNVNEPDVESNTPSYNTVIPDIPRSDSYDVPKSISPTYDSPSLRSNSPPLTPAATPPDYAEVNKNRSNVIMF